MFAVAEPSECWQRTSVSTYCAAYHLVISQRSSSTSFLRVRRKGSNGDSHRSKRTQKQAKTYVFFIRLKSKFSSNVLLLQTLHASLCKVITWPLQTWTLRWLQCQLYPKCWQGCLGWGAISTSCYSVLGVVSWCERFVSSLGTYIRRLVRPEQVRNQLGTPGGAKSFLRVAQIF